MPKLCLKCGNYDPTPHITSTSRCPCCGVVYAKLSVRAGPTGSNPAAVTHRRSWKPISATSFWSSVTAGTLLFALVFFDDDGFIPLLDHANLAFHEAGHLLFGILGSTLGLYGGTLGQLVFPLSASIAFWRAREAVGLALSGLWLFENFLNIARYMGDARSQTLPLVGGGEHDWYHIFSRWGVLDADTGVAASAQVLGWLGMFSCMLWLWWQRRAQRRGAGASVYSP